MPLPRTLSVLGIRFERMKRCPRSPWLWLGPTIFCLLVAVSIGLAQQNDPRWPPRQYAVLNEDIRPADSNYVISLVFDKHDGESVVKASEEAPSLADLAKQDKFRLYSMPRTSKDIPFSFKPYLEKYPHGTVMVIQDKHGNVVDADNVRDPKDVVSMIAGMRK